MICWVILGLDILAYSRPFSFFLFFSLAMMGLGMILAGLRLSDQDSPREMLTYEVAKRCFCWSPASSKPLADG